MILKYMSIKQVGTVCAKVITLDTIDDIIKTLSSQDPREVLHNGLINSEIEKSAPDPLSCSDIDEVIVWCFKTINFIVKNLVSRWRVYECISTIIMKYGVSQNQCIKILSYMMYCSMPKYYRDKINVQCNVEVDVNIYPKCKHIIMTSED